MQDPNDSVHTDV